VPHVTATLLTALSEAARARNVIDVRRGAAAAPRPRRGATP